MTESDYEQIISKSLQRFRDLYQQREGIDVELVKLRQFMYATVHMVPDKERSKWEGEIDAVVKKATATSASLAESVRRLFRNHASYGFTAGTIRQMLLEAGFDFSSYVSNPLSSISTTLRRMVETGELETRESTEGVTLYIKKEPSRKKMKKTQIPY
jgi:hypothetical protein